MQQNSAKDDWFWARHLPCWGTEMWFPCLNVRTVNTWILLEFSNIRNMTGKFTLGEACAIVSRYVRLEEHPDTGRMGGCILEVEDPGVRKGLIDLFADKTDSRFETMEYRFNTLVGFAERCLTSPNDVLVKVWMPLDKLRTRLFRGLTWTGRSFFRIWLAYEERWREELKRRPRSKPMSKEMLRLHMVHMLEALLMMTAELKPALKYAADDDDDDVDDVDAGSSSSKMPAPQTPNNRRRSTQRGASARNARRGR